MSQTDPLPRLSDTEMSFTLTWGEWRDLVEAYHGDADAIDRIGPMIADIGDEVDRVEAKSATS